MINSSKNFQKNNIPEFKCLINLNMNAFWVCGIISIIIYSLLYDWAFILLFALMVSFYFLLSFIFVPASASVLNTPRRKVALSSWSDPDSPECHGHFKIRISKSLAFLERFYKETGKKITITHLAVKVIADILTDFRDMTGRIAFGRYIPYDTIDIGCLVALEGGKDLSFVCIRSADKKSLLEISKETEDSVKSLREGEGNVAHKKMISPFKFLPASISSAVIDISSFLAVLIGVSIPLLGVKKYPCGSMVITNVGSTGVEVGYAPFPCMLRVPSVVALSAIKEEPVIDNGNIVAEKILTILATIDHRYTDGTRATKIMHEIRKRLENPEDFLSFN